MADLVPVLKVDQRMLRSTNMHITGPLSMKMITGPLRKAYHIKYTPCVQTFKKKIPAYDRTRDSGMGLSGQRVRPKIWRVTLGEGEQILSVLRWYKVVDTCLRRRGCGYMKSEDWRERVSLGNHFVGCRQRTFWLSEGAWLWAGKFPISLYFPFIANNTIYLPL